MQHREESIKNPQNRVNVIYEWPFRIRCVTSLFPPFLKMRQFKELRLKNMVF